ncbi:hypothetical protein EDD22DRAFT_855686, partial [Suillus occidentalis]
MSLAQDEHGMLNGDDTSSINSEDQRGDHDDGPKRPSELSQESLHLQARQRRRGIRRVVALYNSIEELITENDRRYDDNEDAATIDQERLHAGYNTLVRTLPWLLKTSSHMEHDDYTHMLKL